MAQKHREQGYDNLKGLLIICVVLGHMLEAGRSDMTVNKTLRIIYSFHMPAFIFIAGHFGKFNGKKLVLHYLVTYVVFQTLYCLMGRYVFHTVSSLQFITPYWLLWYLPVLAYYHGLLPLLDRCQKPWLLCIVSVILSLVVGYCPAVGYKLSLSRFFVFLPFFLLGHYVHAQKKPLPLWAKALLTAAVVTICVFLCTSNKLTVGMMYGAYPYEILFYGPLQRLALLAFALIWIGFFREVALPLLDRRIPLLTCLGQNTLPVFLFHGFFVRFLILLWPEGAVSLPVQLCGTLLLLFLLGNPLASRLLPSPHLEKLWKRRKRPDQSVGFSRK